MAFLDETGLAELWSLVRTADVKIETGSYTGTGTYGASNPNSLTFAFRPKAVLVFGTGGFGYPYSKLGVLYGSTRATITTNYSNFEAAQITWVENTLKWSTGGNAAGFQLNQANAAYSYIAIG